MTAIDGVQSIASPNASGAPLTVETTFIWRADHLRTNSFFQASDKRFVFVGSLSAYDDTVINHEFGHYVDALFTKSDSPVGIHFIG